MENNKRRIYDVLEQEENIIWQGTPDVQKAVMTEYIKVFVLILAMGIMGGVSVSLLGKILANNHIIIALPIIISILALIYALVKQVQSACTAKSRFSMENYAITDRRILIQNKENPEWLVINYHKIRRLETYELTINFSGNNRTINIITQDYEQEIVCLNHVEDWRNVCKMIFSQKHNVSVEEVDINDDFFYHMAQNSKGRGYHRIYFWA